MKRRKLTPKQRVQEVQKELPEPSSEELAAIEADADEEMFGSDAEYFRYAGIDDIGNK